MSLNLGKAIKLLKHYHDHLNQPEVSRAYQAIIPKATWDDQTKDPQQRYFQKLFRIGSHQVDLFFLTPAVQQKWAKLDQISFINSLKNTLFMVSLAKKAPGANPISTKALRLMQKHTKGHFNQWSRALIVKLRRLETLHNRKYHR